MQDGQKDKAKIVGFVHKYRMAQYGRMILVSDYLRLAKANQQ